MEAGREVAPEPRCPDVNSLQNAEQGKLDDPAATKFPESGFSNEAESAKPLCSAEEMGEMPADRDGPPNSDRNTAGSPQVSPGAEQMSDFSGSNGFQGASGFPRHRFLWGEEMSRDSAPQNGSSDRTGVSNTPHSRDVQHRNAHTDFPAGNRGSADRPSLPCLWGELKHESPATNKTSGAITTTHQDNWQLETAADDTPEEETEEEEDCKSKLSYWDRRNRESVSSECPSPYPAENEDPALLAMFRAVASSRLAVRSQQKDEPDFMPAQKLAILRELYHAKPLVFLERFRTALREEHLPCFRHLSGNYEADFYCAEVRKAGLGKTRRTRVRNKRYAALQQLIRGGEYFSDEQMRSRDPLLYEHYIGQYLSNQELQELGSGKREESCSFSGILLDSFQEQVIQQRLQDQQEQEEACLEEEEDEDSDGEEDMASSPSMDEWVPDREEKAFLREEFTSRMYQHFLDGKDQDFDYSKVDENPDFDNLDIVSRDEEERYFDEEEPEEADSMEAE